MEQYELPDGWVWVRLDDICDITGGGTPRRDNPAYFEGGNIPWATPTDIDPEQIRLIYSTTTQITERGLDESSTRLVPFGTVLFSSRASIGKIAIAGVPMTTNQGFANLTAFDGINPWYLAYGLRVFTEQIKELGSGTTYLEIAKSALREFLFPVAPSNEQLRIAEKIEALFEQSRTTREALDEIPALLRQFRQAVLAAAFRGELSTRDPNDEPASALLERILEERRRRWEDDLRARGKDPRRYTYPEPVPPDASALPELPEGWCWTTVEAITVNHDGRRIPVKESERKKRQGEYPYYGASGIIDYVDDYLFDGDFLLLGEDGANLLSRSTPIAFQAHGKFWVNNHAHVLSTEGNIPLAYLEHFFNSIDLTFYVTGTAQPKLTQKSMNRIPVPLAPLNEQLRVAARVNSLFSHMEVIEQTAALARRRLDRLDQSILARAFRGELVPQDPNDEPASVLLERIRAERERRAGERASRRKDKGRK